MSAHIRANNARERTVAVGIDQLDKKASVAFEKEREIWRLHQHSDEALLQLAVARKEGLRTNAGFWCDPHTLHAHGRAA